MIARLDKDGNVSSTKYQKIGYNIIDSELKPEIKARIKDHSFNNEEDLKSAINGQSQSPVGKPKKSAQTQKSPQTQLLELLSNNESEKQKLTTHFEKEARAIRSSLKTPDSEIQNKLNGILKGIVENKLDNKEKLDKALEDVRENLKSKNPEAIIPNSSVIFDDFLKKPIFNKKNGVLYSDIMTNLRNENGNISDNEDNKK